MTQGEIFLFRLCLPSFAHVLMLVFYTPPHAGHSLPRIPEGRGVKTWLAVQRQHEQRYQCNHAGGYKNTTKGNTGFHNPL